MTEATAHDVKRQLRDFGIAALVAIVIASCAFVAVRNRELIEHQLDLADRSAIALAGGNEALPSVHGAIVSAAAASPNHPYLRHRRIAESGIPGQGMGPAGTDFGPG